MARPKSDPYIYKIDNNYWAFFNRNDRRSLGTKDSVAAAQKFGEILQHYGSQEPLSKDKTVAEIAKITLDRAVVNNSKKTAYEDGLNLVRVSAWLETNSITSPSKITKDIIEQYKASRKVGASRINRELTTWKKAMKIAVELKQAKKEILFAFDTLPEPKPNPARTVPSKDQLHSFMDCIDLRYLPLCRLTLSSGIRADEARHLQAENIVSTPIGGRMHHSVIITPLASGKCECCPKGWSTKNYRYRTIPISAEAYEYAKAFISTRRDFNLHKKSSERTVWGAMYNASIRAGIEPISMHDLRHCYASYLLDAGFKIATIKDYLGHSSIEVTMRYLHAIDMKLEQELPF